MAVRKNRATAQLLFRWSVSVVTVLVVARVLQDWFHVREQWRGIVAKGPNFMRPFDSYVIVHTNSSLRTHLCLAAVIALGALQISLVWRLRPPRRWWVPPAIELMLSVLFSIAAAQVLGHYLEGCEGGAPDFHCVVQLPLIFHDGWAALFAVVGMGIGLLWSWTARISSDTAEPDPRSPSEVNSTTA
jgi:hypothetical protein